MNASIAAFDERADYEKGFAAHFAQHIAPCLDELETQRQGDFNKFSIVSAMSGAIVLAAAILMFFSGNLLLDTHWGQAINAFSLSFSKHGNNVVEGKIKILLSLICLASIWPTIIYVRYANQAKHTLLPSVLKFFGDLTYYPTITMPKSQLEAFGIMPYHTIYNSEDHIGGTLDDVKLSLSELRLKVRRRKSTKTVFHGVAIILQMNKPFEGKTIVRSHQGWLTEKLGAPFSLESVELEDVVFSQQFDVYSSDQVEARYLLTTAFMERLMELASLMGHWGESPISLSSGVSSSKLSCSFYEDSLLLMVPCSNDMFQPGTLFKSAYNIDDIRNVLHQIYLIRCIIQTLKLDQRSSVSATQLAPNENATLDNLTVNAPITTARYRPPADKW